MRTRKEAIAAGAVWLVFFVWVVGVSHTMGYGSVDRSSSVMGLPSWVFWGIVLPFVVATVVNCLLAFFPLKDDEKI